MRTRRFYRLELALLLVIGCIVFGDRSLIKDAQAQQQSAPPPPPTPPTQSPAVNPSNPSTAPQQSYMLLEVVLVEGVVLCVEGFRGVPASHRCENQRGRKLQRQRDVAGGRINAEVRSRITRGGAGNG